MSNIDLIGYGSRVEYKVYNKDFGWARIPEPIGWDEDEKELKRSDKVFGVFTELSNDLEFTNEAYGYIFGVYSTYGVEAEIILVKNERNSSTDEWENQYYGYLDLTTLEISEYTLKCKFNESSFYKKIQARDTDDFELTRLDTANGIPIDELLLEKVEITPRTIFLQSRLKYDNQNPTIIADHSDILFQLDYEGRTVPWAKDFAGDTLVDPVLAYGASIPINNNGDWQDGEAANMFYGINDRYKILTITLRLKVSWACNGFPSDFRVYFVLLRYGNGGDYNFVKEEELDKIQGQPVVNDYLLELKFSIQLLEGESLCLGMKTVSTYNIHFTFDKDNFLLVEEDSTFDPTLSNVLLPHEAGERLVEIMTDSKKAFKSDFFGRTNIYQDNGLAKYTQNGAGAYIGMLYGFWIRGFDATPPEIPEDISDEDRADIIYEKPITTSFNDWFNSYSYTFNLGYGIETYAGKERIVVEELKYFFENEIRIIIPNQVSNIVRTPAIEYMYTSLSFGQKNGADFEENNGLDEYNVTNKYTTNLIRASKKLENETEYRKDSYAIELLRRKQKLDFPSEDTNNDEAVFMYDMKMGVSGVYEGVLWQDRFDEEPKNVFSPETAQNLWLSPANCMNRFGWWLKACLQLHPSEYIRYISSNGNSSLVTKLIGGNEIKENGRFKNADLERNLFKPEWVEFDYPVTSEIKAQVYGSTDGKPNYYGLVSFFNKENVQEFGYLFSLKPNGDGKWKLLKANR